MNKKSAKTRLANVAARQGLKIQMKAGRSQDSIRILNARGQVVASGTVKLDSSRRGYVDADVEKIVSQIQTRLNASKMPASRMLGTALNSSKRRKMNCSWSPVKPSEISQLEEDWGYAPGELADIIKDGEATIGGKFLGINDDEDSEYDFIFDDGTGPRAYVFVGDRWYSEDLDSSRRGKKMNSSKRRKMNAGCHGRKRLNSADDVESDEYVESDDDYIKDDAEFVEDVESVVTDEQGNEIVVDEMLVVQDPETNEISLFVPTEEDESLPENVEVIGEVVAADDTVLDSSRRKLSASKRRR